MTFDSAFDTVSIFFSSGSSVPCDVTEVQVPRSVLRECTDVYSRDYSNVYTATYTVTETWTLEDATLSSWNYDFADKWLKARPAPRQKYVAVKDCQFYLTATRAMVGSRDHHSIFREFSGTVSFHENDGRLAWECSYHCGVHKVCCHMYKLNGNSNVVKSLCNSMGQLTEIFHHRNGILIQHELHNDGKKLKKEIFDPDNGAKLHQVTYRPSDNLFEWFFPGEVLKRLLVRTKDNLQVLVEQNFELKVGHSSVMVSDEHFDMKGDRHGRYDTWHYDAKNDKLTPTRVSSYNHGTPVGRYSRYSASGELLERADYTDDGKLNGDYLLNSDEYTLRCSYSLNRRVGIFMEVKNGVKKDGQYAIVDGKSVKCGHWTTIEVATGLYLRECFYNDKGFRDGLYMKQKDGVKTAGCYAYLPDWNRSVKTGRWLTAKVNAKYKSHDGNPVICPDEADKLDVDLPLISCIDFDDRGEFHGYYFSKSVDLVEEGRFNHGVHDGLWRTFDSRGRLIRRVKYAAGKLTGKYMVITSKNKRQTGRYRAGKKDGCFVTEQLNDDFEVVHSLRRCMYVEGVKSGFYEKVLMSSLIRGEYLSGNFYGTWSFFRLESAWDCKSAVLTRQEEYFSFGNKRRKVVHYLRDGTTPASKFVYLKLKPQYQRQPCQLKHGCLKCYDEFGRKTSITNYHMGKQHGVHKKFDYDADGCQVLLAEEHYHHGMKHGDFYSRDKCIEVWKYDRLHGWRREKDGDLILMREYVLGEEHGYVKKCDTEFQTTAVRKKCFGATSKIVRHK